MPGTHLLPPNLLKLFAPRPPLPYARPVDRDIDRICKKDVSGVAQILAQLKEATTDSLITAGQGDLMEEGEEPVFTHAEEIKRQIRREERKAKKTEEFKIAKETCEFPLVYIILVAHDGCQINLPTMPRLLGILIKPCLFLAWYLFSFQTLEYMSNHFQSIKAQRKRIYDANLKAMGLSNECELFATKRAAVEVMPLLYMNGNGI